MEWFEKVNQVHLCANRGQPYVSAFVRRERRGGMARLVQGCGNDTEAKPGRGLFQFCSIRVC